MEYVRNKLITTDFERTIFRGAKALENRNTLVKLTVSLRVSRFMLIGYDQFNKWLSADHDHNKMGIGVFFGALMVLAEDSGCDKKPILVIEHEEELRDKPEVEVFYKDHHIPHVRVSRTPQGYKLDLIIGDSLKATHYAYTDGEITKALDSFVRYIDYRPLPGNLINGATESCFNMALAQKFRDRFNVYNQVPLKFIIAIDQWRRLDRNLTRNLALKTIDIVITEKDDHEQKIYRAFKIDMHESHHQDKTAEDDERIAKLCKEARAPLVRIYKHPTTETIFFDMPASGISANMSDDVFKNYLITGEIGIFFFFENVSPKPALIQSPIELYEPYRLGCPLGQERRALSL